MKRLLIFLSILASATFLSAQIANDALTFGQQYHGGTARYMAMGGAFNALGGDFSTLSVNPAGLGVYRSSEFTFTGDLRFNKTTSSFNSPELYREGFTISDTKSNFNLNNVGYVANTGVKSSGLISLNVAFGYNRLKNYHRAYRAEMAGSTHSLTDSWAGPLDGATSGAFVADQAYLMNWHEEGDDIILDSPLLGGATTDYIKDVVEEGRINEWVFSVGGNFEHILYFGATFGIQDIKMRKEYLQSEYFLNVDDTSNYNHGYSYSRFKSTGAGLDYTSSNDDYFNLYTEEVTNGVGLNGKFGLIFRPVGPIRFGFAVHTPTINFLSVDHYAEMTNNTNYYNDNDREVRGGYGFEDPDSYDYRTISPYKLHGSAAITLGKFLALDAEIDMVDYSSMKIMDTNGRTHAFQETNDAIKEMYKVAYNARAGAELKAIPQFALRAGVAYYGTPYDNNFVYDNNNNPIDAADYVGDRWDYSAGFGFRSADMFLDFAYIHSKQSNGAMVFDDAISPYEYYEMNLDQTLNRYMLTLGFKF